MPIKCLYLNEQQARILLCALEDYQAEIHEYLNGWEIGENAKREIESLATTTCLVAEAELLQKKIADLY